jgi:hypothetical protein
MHELVGDASSHRCNHYDGGHLQFARRASGSFIWLTRLKRA